MNGGEESRTRDCKRCLERDVAAVFSALPAATGEQLVQVWHVDWKMLLPMSAELAEAGCMNEVCTLVA